ncbi:PucR family transcriptional regulator [Streptomyces sp. A7024]|uniref:PucR family transcriptional regulator n=1 Tax=Streptomyces coryli TaxID=1128680 RepID=A0A6G4U0A0_9ACTN|nr:helix-turn-helix domain-containing protein [Streptomyces coryli]NGN65574.1 PucR family transcriptional regulator [Streptomyces coryli]
MSQPPISAAARRLAARLEPRVNELARRMTQDTFTELPGYGALPADMRDVEFAATARHGMRRFLRGVRDGRLDDTAGVLFLERAAQRAEEGLPLHLLVRSHALGSYALWQALRETARPGEEAALVELADLLLDIAPAVLGSIVQTYLDEHHAVHAEQHALRQAVAGNLLDGLLPASRPMLGRLGLDGPAWVLALGAPPGGSGYVGTVAARRLRRRIQTALDGVFAADTAVFVDASGGRALVPGADAPPDDLAERLAQVCGAGIRVAAMPAPGPEEVAEAARTAAEVLRIAAACGRPPGLHLLDDVLLEYHLSRPGESGRRIAALLEPLADQPQLRDTLRTHLAHGRQRRATAAALKIHPNTVDNRLARTAELTGLDLTTVQGTALALAALLLADT